jgi:hypothetical protein
MRLFNRASVRARTRHLKRRNALDWERFENRCMMSFVVSNINASGVGSLAAAITLANVTPNSTITFSVTGVINLQAPGDLLPTILKPTTIQGTTTAGSAPVIEIDGNGLTGDGLVLAGTSQGSTIEGLDIVNFAGAGIHIESAGTTIEGNYLGVALDGTTAGPGNQTGVLIDSVANTTIGGIAAGERNVIAANKSAGISISGTSATGNLVAGNDIGTNSSKQSLGNVVGIVIDNAPGNTIGGTTTGSGNLIAFNIVAGVQIIGTAGGALNSLVESNDIGTDSGGDSLGNGYGVEIVSGSGNSIGGTAAGTGNVIGLNDAGGVAILSGNTNVVRGNTYTGTNGGLTVPSVAANDIILGRGANSGQAAPQLLAAALSADGTTLSLALNGTFANMTTLDVYLLGSSPSERTFLATEVVPANQSPAPLTVTGVVSGDMIIATATVVANGTSTFSAPITVALATTVTNTNPSGPGSLSSAISAAIAGTPIEFNIPGSGSTFVIGVNSALAIGVRMTIDGTSESAFLGRAATVELTGGNANVSGLILAPDSDGSVIEGLTIEDFAAAAIVVQSANNTIGGTGNGQGNTIVSNSSAAVSISGASAAGNVLLGNFIGTKAAGTNLGNAVGVAINGASDNTIGGTTAASANVLGFNTAAAVSISGASATGNVLLGNDIGTTAAGANRGNALGVVIAGASGNTIGGTAAGAGNSIAFNGFDANHGAVTVASGSGDPIQGNLIYNNKGTSVALSGIDLTSGGNNSLAAPIITQVTSSGSGATSVTLNVTGMLAGTYSLDVFASAPGDSTGPNQIQAHILEQTFPVTITGGQTSLPETFLRSLSGGQQVTATWTVVGTVPSGLTTGDTSEFAAPVAAPQPFVVTNTQGSGAGSLAFEIAAVNADATNPSADTIAFQLSTSDPNFNPGSGTWTINTTSASALKITHPVFLDGTTQRGYQGEPVIELVGNGQTGLVLQSTADKSTIRGLDLVDFTGAAVDIESTGNTVQANDIGVLPDGITPAPNGLGVLINGSSNTIGGTVTGASNVIADNTGDGIDVVSGSGNSIRQDSIFGVSASAVAIDLQPGANNGQAAPTIQDASSLGNETNIQFQLGASGFSTGQTYVIEFFASGAPGQALTFLGSVPKTPTSLPVSFNAPLPVSIAVGQFITATATSVNTLNTSELSNSLAVSSPFEVTTTADNALVPIVGSLRQVIMAVNANPPVAGTTSPITFAIPTSDPGFNPSTGIWTISPASALPPIVVPVSLDATTQPGPTTGGPLIELDGGGRLADGLELGSSGLLSSAGSMIKGLDIVGFGIAGIHIESPNDLIIDDVLGTNAGGTAAGPGNSIGVLIENTQGNTIGGSAAGADVIGSNTSAGVSITGVGAVGNLVAANLIGSNSAGALLGNGMGIIIDGGASGNTIGGSTAFANVIAASAGAGVSISGAVTAGNVVAGNFLGTDSSNQPLGNAEGVAIDGAINNTIGGTASLAANVIAFNRSAGVSISGVAAKANLVASNFIGTNPAGTTSLPNAAGVIIAMGASANTIGGATAVANVIASSTGAGVLISGAGATENVIAGNYVGTDSADRNLGNAEGVLIDGAADNTIGGTASTAANVIGFNKAAGVSISGSSATGNLVAGNWIGTEATAGAKLGNGAGIIIETGPATNGNTIGGTVAGAANTIANSAPFAGSTGDAVDVNSGSGNGILENLIYGNHGPIVLAQNANNNQAAPTNLAVASVPNLTTIDFKISGSVGNSYAVEFFANNSLGGPAGQFLGTTSVTLTATTQAFTITFPFATPLSNSQSVTATSTGPDNSTSEFTATAVSPASPFLVTNTTDGQPGSAVGSLRQAILDANSDRGTTLPDDIQFALTGTAPFTIPVGSGSSASGMPLPTMTVPVTIDGTSQRGYNGTPVIEISGGGQAFDGLALGAGSSGSTIEGLSIFGFGNSTSGGFAGIHILNSNNDVFENNAIGLSIDTSPVPANGVGVLLDNASGNTIGGTAAGAPNTIGSNINGGISVLSGNGNVITENLYMGRNGTTTPVEAADISLAPNANNNQAPPVLSSASLLPPSPGDSTTLRVLVSGPFTMGTTLEFYQVESDSSERKFLVSYVIVAPASPVSVQVSIPGLAVGDSIVATATVASNGTSAFSTEITVASEFAVTNTNDSGFGSLRQAIENVNSDPNDSISSLGTIIFQIPTSDPHFNATTGVWTIQLAKLMDTIVKPMMIDGTTQPGYYEQANLDPTAPEAPVVEIADNGSDGGGLVLGAGSAGTTIIGLSVYGCHDGAGIHIESANNTLAADWIGLGLTGAAGDAVGVLIDNGGSNNSIGAANITVQPPPGADSPPITINATNVIAGNSSVGIQIENGGRNEIQNSFIGTSASGQVAIPNGIGIEITDSSGNTVGGTAFSLFNNAGGAANDLVNLISGNTDDGVLITGVSSIGNVVMNSLIGPDLSGSNTQFQLDNGGAGIDIVDATATHVGFAGSALAPVLGGNLISGNLGDGLAISGTASGTVVFANRIGTDLSGNSTSTALANQGYGVSITTANSATIGGALLVSGNVISGNTLGGIDVQGNGHNSIVGNLIGTNVAGTGSLANGTSVNLGPGIGLIGSSANTIGGTAAGEGNVISGNAGEGIRLSGETGDVVLGNKVGTDLTGTVPLGNAGTGVVIDASGSTPSKSVSIGSIDGTGGNLIAGNIGDGLDIVGGSSQNTVTGNTIGATANASLGNNGNGALISGSPNNTIGGAPIFGALNVITSLGPAHNVISGNGQDGVNIIGTPTGAVVVQGNLISSNTQNGVEMVGNLTDGILQAAVLDNFVGTTLDGDSTFDPTSGIPQGNGLDGIRLEQNSTATLSGTVSGVSASISGNVSSDNGLSGISVQTTGMGITYANILITANMLGTDRTGTNTNTFLGGLSVPFGNALDGILINEVLGVSIGGTAYAGLANVVSGNLGQGIAAKGNQLSHAVAGSENLISFNMIGVDITGEQVDGSNPARGPLGNLSDGIFLLDPGTTLIQHNTISNNRSNGIHAQVDNKTTSALTIIGNMIGTDQSGAAIAGNDSDGIFLDEIVSGVTIGGAGAAVSNVISGNHSNGIDLLDSTNVLIARNAIGTNTLGNNDPTQTQGDFGNASDGIFLNQSDFITIGGAVAASANLISGNHSSGVFISGTELNTAQDNIVEGNTIGMDTSGSRQISNAVAGIVLSNAGSNKPQNGNMIENNFISGNLLDGILLVNNVQHNLIEGNLIGTNKAGTAMVPNSADGILLLGVTTNPQTGAPINGTITGNAIAGNIISGNSENGIEIFGTGAFNNSVSGNTIGLSVSGTPIPNHANGVFLNNAGAGPNALMGNSIGGATATPGTGLGNVITGNGQAGINISSTTNTPTDATIEGNLIGINSAGTVGNGNRSYGVVIFGSSSNTIGGSNLANGMVAGNVISGNASAGILIDSPSPSAIAQHNVVAGNRIGTDSIGMAGEGNGSDGVQLIDGQFNVIGGLSPADLNVISGNADNGVFIEQVPGATVLSLNNQVIGNDIGTNIAGSAGIPNQGSGVEIADGSGNKVGGTSGGATVPGTEVPTPDGAPPGNLISGNIQWGIQIVLTGASPGEPQTVIEGNIIGLDVSGTSAIGNGQGGILVDNLSNSLIGETIGGAAATAGNLISGNTNVGIELIGPQVVASGTNDTVQGNLIGLNAAGNVVTASNGITGNGTGILINNSPDNLIGGTNPSARNVISGNGQNGVEISQVRSEGNQVEGNLIGTNVTGSGFPDGSQESSPAQSVGVLMDGVSGNTVGGTAPGAGNVISGNSVGVEISNFKQNGGQVLGSGDFVVGNLIGTDASGTQPVSNLDLGVFIDNAQGSVIGPGNFIAANGIGGVEILGQGSTGNLITGNTIGEGVNLQVFRKRGTATISSNAPEPGIPVYPGAQLNGVVVLGASQNTIGLNKKIAGSKANAISGNVQVGVYITSRDYNGLTYTVPAGNAVSGNTVRSNGNYGVLLYNAPNNPVPPFDNRNKALVGNKYKANPTNFRNFQGAFDRGTSLSTRSSKPKKHTKAIQARPLSNTRPISVRPRVPALFETKKPHNAVVVHRPHGKRKA